MNTLIKRLAIAAVVALIGIPAFAQKPKIMVLPDYTWLGQHGFLTEVETNDGPKDSPEYIKAIRTNTDLKNVKTTVERVFTSHGYEIDDIELVYSRSQRNNRVNTFRSSQGGAQIQKKPLDLLAQAQADITFEIGWEVEKLGSQQSLTYRIETKDPYSVANVATNNGTRLFNNYAPAAAMLEQVVLAYLPELERQFMEYRDRIAREGRQIALEVRVWDNAPFNMSTEYGGVELTDIITNWISDNTVGHRFTSGYDDMGENNRVMFDKVHIPLKDKNGRPMRAREFANLLIKYLKDNFGIIAANKSTQLGNGLIILGEK